MLLYKYKPVATNIKYMPYIHIYKKGQLAEWCGRLLQNVDCYKMLVKQFSRGCENS